MSEIVSVPKELIEAVLDVSVLLDEFMMPNDRLREKELFVVWSSKVLQNWKGIVGCTRPGSSIFEVTHNGNTGVTYVDVYKKTQNMSLYNGQLIGLNEKGEIKR